MLKALYSIAVFALIMPALAGCAQTKTNSPAERVAMTDDVASIREAMRRPLTPKQVEDLLQPKALSSVRETAKIAGLDGLPCMGLGLVTGLDGNGSEKGNLSPDLRKAIYLELAREEGRDLTDAQRLVNSRDSSIVKVTGLIPAGAPAGTAFDVHVEPVTGDATISLQGGYLHKVALRKYAREKDAPGIITGDIVAKAEGGVTAGAAEAGSVMAVTSNLRAGVVFDGGTSSAERILIFMLGKRSSGRLAALVEFLINKRFYNINADPGMPGARYASAVSNGTVFVQVPPAYNRYIKRFADVIMELRGSFLYGAPPAAEIAAIAKELSAADPQAKYAASVKLEAVGPAAAPYLEKALDSGDDWTRFYAGQALSYMNSPRGPQAVIDAAKSPDEEVRYQAVRFLGQITGRRTIETLQAALKDPSPRIVSAAVESLVLVAPEGAARIKLNYFDLVRLPAPEPAILVRSLGRPMVALAGSDAPLVGEVSLTLPGIGIGTVDATRVGIVMGAGPNAQTLTVDATLNNVLTAVSRANPDFTTMKRVIALLESKGNVAYKITWLD